MDSKGFLVLGGVAVIGYLIWQANQNNANASTPSGGGSSNTGPDATDDNPANALDLSGLQGTYATANVQALQNLENELANGRGLTALQQQMLLAQACQETGLLTDAPNWNAVSVKNNYGGMSSGGQIITYNSISDFCDAWINYLSSGAAPINADNIQDYNNRLVAIGYYTDSPTTYGNDLTVYFNLISNQ